MFAIFAMHKHLEWGSKRHTLHSGATFLHSHSPLFSLSSLVPALNAAACFRSCFPLSLSWLHGTPFRVQSPPDWGKRWKHMRARTLERKWTHVIICKHKCTLGCGDTDTIWYTDECMHPERQRAHTHTHTHTHIYIHTHKHSPPKSSSVMPSHPTLDKPLCEPDKAGEGTQQPLNTGAGCIRQLGVPADCIHTRNWRVLYLVLCDSGKTFQELHLNGFVISPLIDSSKWWPAVRPSR